MSRIPVCYALSNIYYEYLSSLSSGRIVKNTVGGGCCTWTELDMVERKEDQKRDEEEKRKNKKGERGNKEQQEEEDEKEKGEEKKKQ